METERLARHPERFGVEVGGAAVISLDGVGPAVLPLVRFDWSLRPWFVVQAALAGLGTRPTVDGQAGSAQVAQAYGLARRQLSFPRGRAAASFRDAVRRRAAHGGRGTRRRTRTRATPWSNGRFSSTRASVRCCAYPIASTLSLAAHAQLAEPYVAVRFVDTVVATSARPNLLLTLTVGAWL